MNGTLKLCECEYIRNGWAVSVKSEPYSAVVLQAKTAQGRLIWEQPHTAERVEKGPGCTQGNKWETGSLSRAGNLHQL